MPLLTLTCPVCGREFLRKPYEVKRNEQLGRLNVCSRGCQATHMNKSEKKQAQTKAMIGERNANQFGKNNANWRGGVSEKPATVPPEGYTPKRLRKRPPKSARFVGRCDQLQAEDLNAYDESCQAISNSTFHRLIGNAPYYALEKQCGYRRERGGLRLARDVAVSYSKGTWKEQPAVCCMWSAYHHIFVLED